jgi:hypothetical protein
MMRSELSDNAWSEPVTQVRVLVADDDKGVRAHFVSLLRQLPGRPGRSHTRGRRRRLRHRLDLLQ